MLRIVHQISCGIADIHDAGVVHRDIKPNNVKFDSEGRLKIFDFNLARLGHVAQTQGFRGTPGFAAPEQYSQETVSVPQSADVYALAAMIAYLCDRGTLPEPLCRIPPVPSDWPGAFQNVALLCQAPQVLTDVLNAALAYDPDARPTASAVRDVARDCICRDQHRALICIRGNRESYTLDKDNRAVRLSHGGAEIVIKYDGLAFIVAALNGGSTVNRIRPAIGDRLPSSCVIDLDRKFITFDVSHPEVIG
jgi:serine/threonine-protein kinase